MQSKTLKIEGMRCGSCASAVKALIEREPGVQAAEISHETGEARILFDPAKIDEQELISIVERPGYRVVAA